MTPTLRWSVAIVVVFAVIAIGISHQVYDATSPSSLPFHELWRKAYSIIAFAVVGAILRLMTGAGLRRTAFAVAGVSLVIEIGQYLHGSHEGLLSNGIDVVCGFIGGWIGGTLIGLKRS